MLGSPISFLVNQKGPHETYKLILPGRVVLDSYDIMKDQHNETSYKLEDLAKNNLALAPGKPIHTSIAFAHHEEHK